MRRPCLTTTLTLPSPTYRGPNWESRQSSSNLRLNPTDQEHSEIDCGGLICHWSPERIAVLYPIDPRACFHTALVVPGNQSFDYSPLIPFLSHCLNNLGDPFHQTNYRANTHQFEREVILHFAQFMGLDPEDAWGYVTSGGTEGNMYSLYLARELHPAGYVLLLRGSTLLHPQDCPHPQHAPHHGQKAAPNGEVDYDDLRYMLTVHQDRPAIILATIGTTMRGAVDDIPAIRQIINELGIREHYIHADAALSGMILPYVDDPQPFGFDAGIDSISISGHKLIGAPLPCGIVHHTQTPGRNPGPSHRTCGCQRHHPVRFPQRPHAAHALVRHQPLQRR